MNLEGWKQWYKIRLARDLLVRSCCVNFLVKIWGSAWTKFFSATSTPSVAAGLRITEWRLRWTKPVVHGFDPQASYILWRRFLSQNVTVWTHYTQSTNCDRTHLRGPVHLCHSPLDPYRRLPENKITGSSPIRNSDQMNSACIPFPLCYHDYLNFRCPQPIQPRPFASRFCHGPVNGCDDHSSA